MRRAVRTDGQLLDNVLHLSGGKYVEGIERRVTDLMSIPSPYLDGLMDKFFDQGLRPLIEFTRGCPYACTFCTDFHPHRNKVYWRTAEVARREMEYMASHMKVPADMVLADLNYGQYAEDVEVAKIIRSTIEKYGWPRSISCSPGKSHPERVMECVKIINGKDRGVMKFASSVQSTDKTVLSAIVRKNLPIDKLRPIMEAANTHDDYTEYFTEIILGLARGFGEDTLPIAARFDRLPRHERRQRPPAHIASGLADGVARATPASTNSMCDSGCSSAASALIGSATKTCRSRRSRKSSSPTRP